MSKLNIAVAGLAHGWKFVQPLIDMEDVNLIALCGKSKPPHKKASSLLPEIPYYEGYMNMFEDIGSKINGLIAAVPNDLHVAVTEEAAKRGIPVLMEKPIACTVEEAGTIIDIVKKSNLKYLVGHHRRFSAKINLAKKIYEEGLLGRLIGVCVLWTAKKPDEYYTHSWRIEKGVGGPLLINAIHDVDDLRYIIGDIEVVQGLINNDVRNNQVEDNGSALFKFKKGCTATLLMTDASPSIWFYEACAQEDPFFHPSYKDCYYFFGDKGSLAFPNMELVTYNEKHGAGWHRPYQKYHFPVPRVNPIEEETRHFCAVIRGEEEPLITAEDATESLRVIEALEDSSNQGKLVKL